MRTCGKLAAWWCLLYLSSSVIEVAEVISRGRSGGDDGGSGGSGGGGAEAVAVATPGKQKEPTQP